MTYIITGDQASGKTVLAERIIKDKKYFEVDNEKLKYGNRFILSRLPHGRDYIYFSDIVDVDMAFELVKKDRVIVEKARCEPFEMITPDVIIVCDYSFDITDLKNTETKFCHIHCDMENED